jgi:N-acetylneuraminic acid mutarotase
LRSVLLHWFIIILVFAICAAPAIAQTHSDRPSTTLSFADRVAYQYAIEEVYWHHRIWPKENPGQKPALDSVLSRQQVENKVEKYSRDSQRLADEWQRPITPEQLQAEMDRMASHTKDPEVLRELFAALGNDPLLIAECLARPILAERLAADLSVAAGVSPALRNSFAADTAASTGKNNAHYTLPEISAPLDCTNDTWTPTTLTNAPAGRELHTTVWTGSEMIIWGGTPDGGVTLLNTGGRYNPSTDSWTATSITNAPAGRWYHTAVWTGTQMIVWGGIDDTGYSNIGGEYDPSTDSWTPTSTTGVPTGRYDHTAVWTGTEMIVWGGYNGSSFINTGGRYDPNTDSWTATSTANAPDSRDAHTAVWTGSEMIVWGGYNGSNVVDTGGIYSPGTNSWTPTTTTSAPVSRDFHTAVWTGSEMIVWGGTGSGTYFNTGGRYSPSSDSWTATSTSSAPAARARHTAVWTSSQMIIWGGYDGSNVLSTGGRYTTDSDTWTVIGTTGAPAGRAIHTAVWTGSQMIVWGGASATSYFNTGGRYCAQPSAPIVQSAVSRKTHAGAGNFDVSLPLSGTPGIECRSGGGTNDYTMVVTFLANVSINGSPQAAVTAGTGTIGSGGVSNGGTVTISGNVVTIPLTNVSNAQTINVTLNSVNESTNIVIPMSILVGDTNANGTVNAADVAQTKARLGQTVDGSNFRSDVNANGSINAADTAIIKQNSGTSLPP